MSKKFQLQIPEPCHENWDKMTPVDKGRFCDSCQKAVHDFTGMSDAQLIAFFRKPSTGSVCGRFYNEQLDRDLVIPRKRIPWVKYFFQFTIPLFLGGFKSYSQEKPGIELNDTASICTKTTSTEQVIFGNLQPRIRGDISGKVIDESGNGVSYASVVIKGTANGVACDSAGNFYLRIPKIVSKLTLITSCIGFKSGETVINPSSLRSLEIVLNTEKNINTGVVVTAYGSVKKGGVMGIMVTRRSTLQKVKDYFVKDSFNVFPNPAKPGNEIKIEWNKAIAGEYIIDLFNLQGQLIQSTPSKIESGTTAFTIYLSLVTPGPYLMQLTNKKTGKKHAEKIIIQ